MSQDELREVLKDDHLPLSNDERNFLIDLKGIDKDALTIEEIVEKYPHLPKNLPRFYQRAILTIKKYQNKEIKPQISYLKDIVPNQKYFTKFENKVLDLIYKENIPLSKINTYFNVTNDVMQTHIDQLKMRLTSYINEDGNSIKFDFEKARELLHKDNLPLEGPKENLIKIYEMFLGEDGNPPRSSKEIAKAFKTVATNDDFNIAKYAVLLAVSKHQRRIKGEKTFTYDEAKEYYERNKDNLSYNDKIAFNPLIKKDFKPKTSISTNQIKSKYINNLLIKDKEEKAFSFKNATEKEVKAILNNQNLSLNANSRKVLRNFLGITSRDVMSKKEKKHLYKIIGPYLNKEKDMSNQIKIKQN